MNFWIKPNKMTQSSRSRLSEIKPICTMKEHLLPNKNQNNILTNILVNRLANIFQHLPRYFFRVVHIGSTLKDFQDRAIYAYTKSNSFLIWRGLRDA